MLNSTAMPKIKLDMRLKFIKNRFRFPTGSMALLADPASLSSNCHHEDHATNPDRRAAPRHAMLIAINIAGKPSQIGADSGA